MVGGLLGGSTVSQNPSYHAVVVVAFAIIHKREVLLLTER